MSARDFARAPPSFVRQLWLLWELRLVSALNGGARGSHVLAVASFAVASLPAVALGLATFRLMSLPAVADSPEWTRFALNLLGFVTSAGWATWPLLSAGVDDQSELSRFAAFPLGSFRLLLASVVASLLVPRALVFHAPLVGAAASLFRGASPATWAGAAALFFVYALMNAAWSRAGLHGVLNVLRQRRSGQILGGSMLLFLGLASLIPPIDTAWLRDLGGGAAALDLTVIRDAGLALGRVPSGFLGEGWRRLLSGGSPVFFLAAELASTALGLSLAHHLLLRFYRYGDRGVIGARPTRDLELFRRPRSVFRSLVLRELVDLWRNPRARILASVPFLLAIVLRLLSGRDLLVYLLGGSADAWLLGGLSLYGALVLSGTFAQNAFAYDGHGLTLLMGSPVPLSKVLLAKNLVHGAAAMTLATLSALFYLLYFRTGGAAEVACALLGSACLTFVTLASGNFLSLVFPVKFHAALNRRDRLPFAAALLGVGSATLGATPFLQSLQLLGRSSPGELTLVMLGMGLVSAGAVYLASLPWAMRLLAARSERVLAAVTRG